MCGLGKENIIILWGENKVKVGFLFSRVCTIIWYGSTITTCISCFVGSAALPMPRRVQFREFSHHFNFHLAIIRSRLSITTKKDSIPLGDVGDF
jgi:hypothetical protein